MKLQDIVSKIEQIYPLTDKLFDSDNIGLQVGNIDAEIRKVLVTLDMTPETLDEALYNDVDLVIAHHPFIFNGLKSVKLDDYFGSVIAKLLQNDIALYVIHTNYDNSENGMGYHLLQHLGVKDISFVESSPLVHGEFANKLTHEQFVSLIKTKYKLDHVRFSGSEIDDIKRIGIIGGSGFDEQSVINASKYKLDAYVSGDMKYKDALLAKTLNLNVYDVGHYVENIGFEYLVNILKKEFKSVEVNFSELNNPHFVIK